MGLICRLLAAHPMVSYPFLALALGRGTLWLWLQYEQTRTAVASLRRSRTAASLEQAEKRLS